MSSAGERTEAMLSDIRILKLAEMYERAYEAFVLEMAANYVQDAAIRAKLAKLVAPTDLHAERIAAQIERLNAQLRAVDAAAVERAAIQDVLEVERSARAFYRRFTEALHDKTAAGLFRALAREEAEHVRIAEEALDAIDKKTGRARLGGDADRFLRSMEDAPVQEGSVDELGPTRMLRTHEPPGA